MTEEEIEYRSNIAAGIQALGMSKLQRTPELALKEYITEKIGGLSCWSMPGDYIEIRTLLHTLGDWQSGGSQEGCGHMKADKEFTKACEKAKNYLLKREEFIPGTHPYNERLRKLKDEVRVSDG